MPPKKKGWSENHHAANLILILAFARRRGWGRRRQLKVVLSKINTCKIDFLTHLTSLILIRNISLV